MDKNKAYQSRVSPKVLSGGRSNKIQSMVTKLINIRMPTTEKKCIALVTSLLLLNNDSIAKIKNKADAKKK